jgi:hypothetical protein
MFSKDPAIIERLDLNDLARVRAKQTDSYFEEIREVGKNPVRALKTTTKAVRKADGATEPATVVETVECDAVERARLHIDSLKWLAAKLAPKKYGDKVTTEHSGPDGGPIKTEEVTRFPPQSCTGSAPRQAMTTSLDSLFFPGRAPLRHGAVRLLLHKMTGFEAALE